MTSALVPGAAMLPDSAPRSQAVLPSRLLSRAMLAGLGVLWGMWGSGVLKVPRCRDG